MTGLTGLTGLAALLALLAGTADRLAAAGHPFALIRVAAVEDLLAMKRAAGRPQDLADVAALESLRRTAGDQDG